MAELLDEDKVNEALSGLTDWQRDGNSIVRTAKLPSFLAAIEVVRDVAALAEERSHHPDIDIRYWKLTFRLSTHSEGGITGKDIELAGEIDRVLAQAGAGSA